MLFKVVEVVVDQSQSTTLLVESAADKLISIANCFVYDFLVPFVERLPIYLNRANEYLFVAAHFLVELVSGFAKTNFSEFQIKLLQVFLAILFTHFIAIFVAWKIYGQQISDRFLKSGTWKYRNFAIEFCLYDLLRLHQVYLRATLKTS